MQGLLEDYLGEALDAFPPDLRGAAIALLGQMVTAAGTRNVMSAADLVSAADAERLEFVAVAAAGELRAPVVAELRRERLEADAFCARLADGRRAFGTLPAGVHAQAIIDRAVAA